MPRSIWITGDTHGLYDMGKLSVNSWKEQHKMDKSDYLIVSGDTGICWNGFDEKGNDRDHSLKDMYNKKKFTTLWIDGNHENFDALNRYKVESWNGGKVHRITDSIIHLMRGQVYEIYGKKFFTFGGGYSMDKSYRTPGISWWPQEMPVEAEYQEGLENLKKHNKCVDYIITHTAALDISKSIFHDNMDMEVPLGEYLQKIHDEVDYRGWYFGHMHLDRKIDCRHTALYDEIVRLV